MYRERERSIYYTITYNLRTHPGSARSPPDLAAPRDRRDPPPRTPRVRRRSSAYCMCVYIYIYIYIDR